MAGRTGSRSSNHSRDDRSVHSSAVGSQRASVFDGSGCRSGDSATQEPPSKVDQRVSWLEEEVAMMQRRIRDLGRMDDVGQGLSNAAAGESNLLQMIARLDSDVEVERCARMALEGRLEVAEGQLQTFAGELERAIGEIISRIEQSLPSNPSRQPTEEVAIATRRIDDNMSALNHSFPSLSHAAGIAGDDAETKLRSLIQRVDEGLMVGAEALQDSLLTDSNHASGVMPVQDHASLNASFDVGVDNDAEQLIRSWNELRRENMVLRKQSCGGQHTSREAHTSQAPMVMRAPTWAAQSAPGAAFVTSSSSSPCIQPAQQQQQQQQAKTSMTSRVSTPPATQLSRQRVTQTAPQHLSHVQGVASPGSGTARMVRAQGGSMVFTQMHAANAALPAGPQGPLVVTRF